jgi:hypothetical protein
MTDTALPLYAQVKQDFPVSFEDRHLPGPDDGENYIENWFLAWHDPIGRAGGYHHVGLRRNQGYADIWNWVMKDGRVVGKYQDLWVPLPDDEMSDFTVANLHAGTIEPFNRHFLRSSWKARDTKPDVELEGEFTAFTPPFALSLNTETVDMASHHYESMGRFQGRMRVDGSDTQVSGWAFKDHSWGNRDYETLVAHRWVWAVFGEDLFMSSYVLTSDTDSREFGFVYDDGVFRHVVAMDGNFRMHDDGLRPRGCDSAIWTADGRGYQVVGEVGAASPSSHTSGMYIVDGFTEFTLGGRRGSGLVEVSQMRNLTPAWRRELMLPERGDGAAGDGARP